MFYYLLFVLICLIISSVGLLLRDRGDTVERDGPLLISCKFELPALDGESSSGMSSQESENIEHVVGPDPTEDPFTHVRWMIRRDLPEVNSIERSSFDFPWEEDDFIRCLRERNSIGMVAERGDDIVGYMLYQLEKTHIIVLNFAVHPKYRKTGVGRAMVEKLKGKLTLQRRKKLVLNVRETNLDAQLFFQNQGFRAVEVIRDFYDETSEDCYVMEYHTPDMEYWWASEGADSLLTRSDFEEGSDD